ncbi:hypothetical protein HPB47_006960, partial [Ixodes persulcatus]
GSVRRDKWRRGAASNRVIRRAHQLDQGAGFRYRTLPSPSQRATASTRPEARQGMEMSTSLVATMAEPLPPDDEELASVSSSISDDNQGEFQDVVRGAKRTAQVKALVLARRLSSPKQSPLLTVVPSCVIVVRYNRRKNLLAIDTRNGKTTRTLLGQTTLCGMKVRAFEPRGKASSVGIVRDINSTLSDSAILGVLCSAVGIRSHVYVGLFQHGVDLSANNRIQCHRCGLFGHVSAVCERSLTCLRCAQPHATTECRGSNTLCVNCKKPHETTSQQCTFWQAERSVCRYHCESNVSFAESRAQIDK